VSALVAAVFVASLLGSLHCAGMCGPLVTFYAGGDESRGWRRSISHLAYNGGRLLTYALLGAAAGAVGAALDLAGSLAGLQRTAAVLAGAFIFLWGLGALLRSLGVKIPAPPAPRSIQRLVSGVARALTDQPPAIRGLALGLASALLPCGWLYAFAVTAAGTGNPFAGMLVMAVFWAGTVPVMASLGLGIQYLAGPLRRHVPALCAVVLMVVGLLAVTGRVGKIGMGPMGGSSVPASMEEAVDQVRQIGQGGHGPSDECCGE
jgi:sulfite exporter TauE/SafE